MCCIDTAVLEAIDSLNAPLLGLYPVDPATLLIQRKMSALEKLEAIPVGRYIKLSDCNTFDVVYFIFRMDENHFTVAKKETVTAFKKKDEERLTGRLKKEQPDWEFCERVGSWSAGLEAFIWIKKENLRAGKVLQIVDPHIIISHEIYEFKTDVHLKKGD